MPHDLSDKVLFLNPRERERLGAWLSQLEPVTAINRGRWHQLSDGSTDYISHKELEHISDVCPPCGFATEIIRGTCTVQGVTMS